jgi:hypothetical protein
VLSITKAFYQESDLLVHQIIHTREKPFMYSTAREESVSQKTNLGLMIGFTKERNYTSFLCQTREATANHSHTTDT